MVAGLVPPPPPPQAVSAKAAIRVSKNRVIKPIRILHVYRLNIER
jgi:hypothetical protein